MHIAEIVKSQNESTTYGWQRATCYSTSQTCSHAHERKNIEN